MNIIMLFAELKMSQALEKIAIMPKLLPGLHLYSDESIFKPTNKQIKQKKKQKNKSSPQISSCLITPPPQIASQPIVQFNLVGGENIDNKKNVMAYIASLLLLPCACSPKRSVLCINPKIPTIAIIRIIRTRIPPRTMIMEIIVVGMVVLLMMVKQK